MDDIMRVGLVSVEWHDHGGWPTYTKHVYRGLRACGVDVGVWTNPAGPRPKVVWREILEFKDNEWLAAADALLVTSFELKDPQALHFLRSLSIPTFIVLHDPRDWRGAGGLKKRVAAIRLLKPQALYFIGRADAACWLKDVGYTIPVRVWPHPYERISDGSEAAPPRVICTSRIDWDNYTHLLLAANLGIELWTGYINPRYNWQHFNGQVQHHPDYCGAFGFDDASIRGVYANACGLVDLAAIVGSGGRTKYTTLEAFDFGLGVVQSVSWGDGELQRDTHFMAVSSKDDLKESVRLLRTEGNPHRAAQEELLARHAAQTVCRSMLEDMVG